MATIPTPIDATAGTKLTAVDLDAGVRDPLVWLMQGHPRCRVYDNTGISAANNTEVQMTWSGETYDNDAMHSTSTNTSRIVFTTDGYYEVFVSIQWAAGTFTGSNIHGRINSAESVSGGTQLNNWLFVTQRTAQVRFTRYFAEGDHIQFWVLQVTGGTISTTAGEYDSYCEVRWVGEA